VAVVDKVLMEHHELLGEPEAAELEELIIMAEDLQVFRRQLLVLLILAVAAVVQEIFTAVEME
jgi:hypothetical protein